MITEGNEVRGFAAANMHGYLRRSVTRLREPNLSNRGKSMKTMTCKQLGGACDEKFSAETFEKIAE